MKRLFIVVFLLFGYTQVSTATDYYHTIELKGSPASGGGYASLEECNVKVTVEWVGVATYVQLNRVNVRDPQTLTATWGSDNIYITLQRVDIEPNDYTLGHIGTFNFIYNATGGNHVGELINDPTAPPVMDRYDWSISFSHRNPTNNGGSYDAYLTKDGASQVTLANSTIYSSGTTSIDVDSDSMEWEQGISVGRPLSIDLNIDDLDEGIYNYSVDFVKVETGTTATGGDVYVANLSPSIGTAPPQDPPDPETDPDPIDPTDPPDPLDPEIPNPDVPGGDTSPGVAENYASMRDAFEDALDNRHLSQEELQTAHENAINKFGLSATNIMKAVSNALKENNQTQEGQMTAVQNALNRQGLSGSNIGKVVANALDQELDENGLTADEIGQAVADAIGTNLNSVGQIGDNEGEQFEADSDGVTDGVSTNAGIGDLGDSLEAMKNGVVTFKDSVSRPIFPQGIEQVSSLTLTLAGNTTVIDFTVYPEFQIFRQMLSWFVTVIFFIGIIKIIRRGVA